MEYIHGTTEISRTRGSVVTLGKFDGFHRGHQKLISYSLEKNQGGAGETVIFTFSTSPQHFLIGRGGDALNTREEKIYLANKMGIDVLIEYPFTEQVRRMDPLLFLKQVLLQQLKAKEIVVGEDWRFGYQGKGTAALLVEMQDKLGYRATVLEKELYRGEVISSSRIKDCLRRGQMEEANAMLGYSYGLTGEIIHGKKLGRTLGIPTINQIVTEEQMMPLSGVYRAEVILDGITYAGICNVGRKPTIAGINPVGVETFLFDFHQDVYGKIARVNFLEFIRPERRFESLEELKKQILQDESIVRDRILNEKRKDSTEIS